MWLWYNTQLISDKESVITTNNRAFQYGDGIFETMVFAMGKIQHSEYHAARISVGVETLKLNFILSFAEIQNRINFLVKKNKLVEARIKMIIWRQPGGYYIPDQRNSEYIITVAPLKKPDLTPQHLEICQEVRLPKTLTRNSKTLNALPYILAGLELKEKDSVDDLLILDEQGNIAECISSNIFWIKEDQYFTPSLETNCVAGVKRAYIIDQIKMKNLKIHEVKVGVEKILNAEYIYKTNITGVFPVSSIGISKFNTNSTLLPI